MKISELIQQLERAKTAMGDAEVKIVSYQKPAFHFIQGVHGYGGEVYILVNLERANHVAEV